jgi:hypothetical protein
MVTVVTASWIEAQRVAAHIFCSPEKLGTTKSVSKSTQVAVACFLRE